MFKREFVSILLMLTCISHLSLAEEKSDRLKDCNETIALLKGKSELLKAKAKPSGKMVAKIDEEALKVEQRIARSITDFCQDAKTWRTHWDFFSKSNGDENPKEIGKRIERELSKVVPGTRVAMARSPEKVSNPSVFYSLPYEITYPVGDSTASKDQVLVTIEDRTLAAKIVSYRNGKPEAHFTFTNAAQKAVAEPFSPEDKNYAAGLEAAITALATSCNETAKK